VPSASSFFTTVGNVGQKAVELPVDAVKKTGEVGSNGLNTLSDMTVNFLGKVWEIVWAPFDWLAGLFR